MIKIKKTFKAISILVLVLTFLSLYGFSVSHVVKGGQRLGILTEPLNYFASFPKTVITVLRSKELRGIPPTYTERDPSFKNINNINYDLFGLNSFYNMTQDLWDIRLFNFKNDSIIHEWYLKRESYSFIKSERHFRKTAPSHCILLPNRSLIAGCNSNNLYKLDENSNVIWHNSSKFFHHSLNMAADGDIWVCASAIRGFKDNRNDSISSYIDDYITKVSVETGQIIFDKSVSEILIENGYKNFVYGFSNQYTPTGDFDPIHLNDIQPVHYDAQHWKKGDLFLSLRNKSLVLLYRPKTNKIIHLLYGPFLNQHDVDIISDKEISLFNNNITAIGSDYPIEGFGIAKNIADKLYNSEIIIYNFEDSTYRKHLQHQFDKEKISSQTKGLHEMLNSGDVFVESQNDGKVYIMNDDVILLRKEFSTSIDNMVERPNWIRIYENINF